jgi:hypothetical protein
MSAPRIAVDGLWRCLCPAFDSIVLSRARLPVSRASYRPCVPRRILRPSSLKLSIAASRRQNSTLAKSVNISNDRNFATEALDAAEPSSETPPPENWGALSVVELHDILRTVRDESGSYQKTINLVQYLIKNRGERPNVRHFDALIRANADAERGSAEEVEGLLKEMDKQGIIGDSSLYHSVLMVCSLSPCHNVTVY